MRSRTALVLLVGLAACGRTPAGPIDQVDLQPNFTGQALECLADIRSDALHCTSANAAPRADGPSLSLIGGQDHYVRLIGSGASFDPETRIWEAQIAVQNRSEQPLGSADGLLPHTDGVRLFLHREATDGVTFENPDGYAVFTRTSQPYVQYAGLLNPTATSDSKPWRFHLPEGVESFRIQLYVSTEIPAPDQDLKDSWEKPRLTAVRDETCSKEDEPGVVLIGCEVTYTLTNVPYGTDLSKTEWYVQGAENNGSDRATGHPVTFTYVAFGTFALHATTYDAAGNETGSFYSPITAKSNALPYKDAVLLDSPLAYWRFDDMMGMSAEDASGNGRTLGSWKGTPMAGMAPLIPDDRSASFQFSSSNAMKVNPAAWMDTDAITVEGWVYAYYWSGTKTIAALEDGTSGSWQLQVVGGVPTFSVKTEGNSTWRSAQASSSAGMDPVYVAGTYDGVAVRIYVNGQIAGETPVAGTIQDCASCTLTVGANWGNGNGANFLGTTIDEVAVYDAALPSERIQAHFDSGRR